MAKFLFLKLKDGKHLISINTEKICAYTESMDDPNHASIYLDNGSTFTVESSFEELTNLLK